MADFVVTGTGRCGTAHFWRVLRRMGVPASHEAFFEAGRRTFGDEGRQAYRACPANDVSLYAAPFLRESGVPSIHLVRDPIETVNSFLHLLLPLSCDHELCEFIRHWVPIEGASDEECWADYWEKWNRLCAAEATLTVRIEDLSSGAASEDALTAIVGAPDFLSQWRELPRTTNRYHEVTANLVPESLVARLRRAGREYGYDG